MADDLLVGIDVGTYGSKGVLCSTSGRIVAEHQVEHGLSVPRPGWAEHDADEVWWKDVCTISQTLLRKASVTGDDVAAIAVSGLGADVVPVDAQGRCLRPAILYGIDVRSAQEIDDLNEQFGAEALAQMGGVYLSSQAMGPKILWIRRHEPDVWRETRYLSTCSTFLIQRLANEYVVDYHSAALFNPLFDIHNLVWSDRYRDAVSGDVPLPRLAWPGQVVGQVTPRAAEQTGLKAGTPVTAGTIDAISEAISVGVMQPGDLMMMYGTTTFFVLILDRVVSPEKTLWHTPYAFPGLYDFEAGMATTGALTRWFRDNFARDLMASQRAGGPNAYTALTEEAQTVPPGCEGLVILPYFSGERTPLMDPQARGIIAGLSLAHGRGHIFRAVLEAIAYGTAHNMEAMRAAGANPRRAVAVGGGAKSELLLQIVSDVTGIEQELPAQTIGAAYGDAFLAGLATGLVPMSALDSQWVRASRRFVPDAKRQELYAEYYRVYRDLYPHAREDMHALAHLGATALAV
jgi:xylulokinase